MTQLYLLAATAHTYCPSGGGSSCDTGLPTVQAGAAQLSTILSIVFGVIGVVAVFMIVYGGFKFVEAQGDPQNIKKARNVILYALVGLIVSVSAEVIVAFVLGKI